MEKKKILIVEDEATLRETLKLRLEIENFIVLEAVDGENGLDVALKNKPDIILADLVMPKMDGAQMIKKIREDEWGKNAKILVLTNLNDADKASELIATGGLESGLSDYLIKSNYELDDLVKRINEELEK